MAKLPPLARTVAVGTTYYRKGDTPPLHHAVKITNPKNWEGGKVPNFEQPTHTQGPTAGATTEQHGVGDESGDGKEPETSDEETGTGAGTGPDAPDPSPDTGDPDQAPAAGDDPGTAATPEPAKAAPRKATAARTAK